MLIASASLAVLFEMIARVVATLPQTKISDELGNVSGTFRGGISGCQKGLEIHQRNPTNKPSDDA